MKDVYLPGDARPPEPPEPAGDDIACKLVDLSAVAVSELRDLDRSVIDDQLKMVIAQVTKPRYNLGSTGPPGRSD